MFEEGEGHKNQGKKSKIRKERLEQKGGREGIEEGIQTRERTEKGERAGEGRGRTARAPGVGETSVFRGWLG